MNSADKPVKKYRAIKEIISSNPVSERKCHIGTESVYEHPYYVFPYHYPNGDTHKFGLDGKAFMISNPEHYPDWFEEVTGDKKQPTDTPKQGRITISHFRSHDSFKGHGAAHWYQFCSSTFLSKEDCVKLVSQIESALNDAEPANPTPLSNTKEQKDWEILSYTSKTNFGFDAIMNKLPSGEFTLDFRLGYNKPVTEKYLPEEKQIHSVKRLSDNQVFTVGDNTNRGVIKSFVLRPDINEYYLQVNVGDGDTLLRTLTKTQPKEQVPLFTTEDGVWILKNEKYWEVHGGWELKEAKAWGRVTDNWNRSDIKNFSTKEAAEQYILENKPCLSLNDLLDAWDAHSHPKHKEAWYKDSPMYKNFESKAKQKLSQ